MPARTLFRRLAVVSATALAVATLTAPSATAAPVFSVSQFSSDTFAHEHSGDCTPTETSTADVSNVPVVENGPVVTHTGSGNATLQNDTVPADTATASTNATVTTKVTSVGLNLGTIDITAQGSGTITTALATSACEVHAGVGGDTQFAFVVGQAGWLTVDTAMTRNSYASFELYEQNQNAYANDYQYDFKQSSTRTIFLPPGSYYGSVGAYLDMFSTASKTGTGTVELHASFALAGSQSVAAAGKGAKYVGLAPRSCATNTVAAVVTSKSKRADKINSVTFFVNGTKVLRDGGPKKSEAYSLPVATDVEAEVRAVVKLKKTKPGKPAKTEEVTSTYLACT